MTSTPGSWNEPRYGKENRMWCSNPVVKMAVLALFVSLAITPLRVGAKPRPSPATRTPSQKAAMKSRAPIDGFGGIRWGTTIAEARRRLPDLVPAEGLLNIFYLQDVRVGNRTQDFAYHFGSNGRLARIDIMVPLEPGEEPRSVYYQYLAAMLISHGAPDEASPWIAAEFPQLCAQYGTPAPRPEEMQAVWSLPKGVLMLGYGKPDQTGYPAPAVGLSYIDSKNGAQLHRDEDRFNAARVASSARPKPEPRIISEKVISREVEAVVGSCETDVEGELGRSDGDQGLGSCDPGITYSYAKVDLNSDGKPEVIVWHRKGPWCGASGLCDVEVFESTPSGLRCIGSGASRDGIGIASTTSRGWSDIVLAQRDYTNHGPAAMAAVLRHDGRSYTEVQAKRKGKSLSVRVALFADDPVEFRCQEPNASPSNPSSGPTKAPDEARLTLQEAFADSGEKGRFQTGSERGCERAVIDREIGRRSGEVRYCYESELARIPDLSGKVLVTFTIDGLGMVSDVTIATSTMNNQRVEQCIIKRVKRWKFPTFARGGSCVINYQWVFTAASEESERGL